MTDQRAFLAVDWGTTNRRVYRIVGGIVEQEERDDRGILAVGQGGFASEAAAIRARMDDLPMLCAGMVGSNRGWIEVPYVDCPADLASVAAGVAWVEPGRTAIVPGVARRGSDHSDVMRGEEVQLLGAVAARLVPENSLLCQPGTHCKWAMMAGGSIASFATAMTGELFALLQHHSLLAAQMNDTIAPNDDFRRGVRDSADGVLLTRLFGVRADFVTGRRGPTAAAYVSGLLIGTDVRAQVCDRAGEVFVLADTTLGGLYAAAIEGAGARAHLIDSHAAFVSGITSIWNTLS
ncbi:2-dehydro-3-deoxygalactonokinase [Sphingomonas psychrolutea]|uniref:2-dehydro-3-deoxygalactonokinase n=1 Tax=Sphingomonas psychrolutea TaxID=1259676 RepID=A0ABQ1G772_9SPHN|nr:2-dehydro-3-deoxygalactonokinase [Sphingomonas psychrolutea]GGA38059.1 2-dehydro-3-deoxygalactonokinase [Sphingomonas psychrolutea]